MQLPHFEGIGQIDILFRTLEEFSNIHLGFSDKRWLEPQKKVQLKGIVKKIHSSLGPEIWGIEIKNNLCLPY